MMDYHEYMANKRVVLVGPAEYLSRSSKGVALDSYDAVVRINNGYIIPRELEPHVGTRTDVVYHSLERFGEYDMNELVNRKVSFLCSSMPNDQTFVYQHMRPGWRDRVFSKFRTLNKGRVKFRVPPGEAFDAAARSMGCCPFSGISAVIDLLQSGLKLLRVVGFTFYADAAWTYNETADFKYAEAQPFHKPELQQKFLMELVDSEPRLRVDAHMQELLWR